MSAIVAVCFCFFSGCSKGKPEDDCEPNIMSVCREGALYWVDSCGNEGEKYEECECGCNETFDGCETPCECFPVCEGKCCGPDGCGSICPDVCQEMGRICDTQTCECIEECRPNCDGRECGDDGCGGSCGDCVHGMECDEEGFCQCVPDCNGRHCGSDGCDGFCQGVPCSANPSSNTILRTIGKWYVFGSEDSVFTFLPDEYWTGSDFLGALFYAYPFPGENRLPMYRLNNYGSASGEARDHMISPNPNEGSPVYVGDENPLFYVSQQHVPGTVPLYRIYRHDPADHSLTLGEHVPEGYVQEDLFGYAYPRAGLEDELLETVSGSQVDLKANLVAGGSVWEIYWGGKQFINGYDFGRQLQIAFQMKNAGEGDNPTEAGSHFSTPHVPSGWRHGSPILHFQIEDTVLTTETAPLQWFPDGFYDGAELDVFAHPVMWNGRIGKRVELDFEGQPNIIHWKTMILLPQDQRYLNMELATAYLTGDFGRFFAYNARTAVLTELTDEIPNFGCVDPAADVKQRPEIGGVFISTADENYGLGVYRNRKLRVNEGYGLCCFRDGATGFRDLGTTKWNLLERPYGGLPAGSYEWELYVLVGSADDVVSAMDWLYQNGY